MPLIKDIDSILKYGAKTTSYKFATLLAIFDYIIENPSERPANNFHFIPIIYLAKQFLMYYYPFSFTDIAQGTLAENKQLRVILSINDLRAKAQEETTNGSKLFKKLATASEDGFKWIAMALDEGNQLPSPLINTIAQIRETILNQPLKFIDKVKQDVIRFFGLMSKNRPFMATYDEHLTAGLECKFRGEMTWPEMMEADDTSLLLDDITFNELARLRFWGREVIIKGWLEYIVNLSANQTKNIYAFDVLELFNAIYARDFERDTELVARYRRAYESFGDLRCVYTGNDLSNLSYHLDHFLPWVYYPVNRFWNLVPSEPRLNLDKSARLPEWTPALETRLLRHLVSCIEHCTDPIIHGDLAYYYHFIQKDPAFDYEHADPEKIARDLLVHVKKGLESLEQIIPGTRFNPDSS